MSFVTLVVLGLFAGAIIGATGVGAGSLMTPMLVGVFRMPLAMAVGTDLWFAALSKLGGAVAHWRCGHVRGRIVLRMLAGSLPASLATSWWLHELGRRGAAPPVLGTALGVALLLTAVTLLARKSCRRVALALRRVLPVRWRDATTVLLGALLGALVTLSSVGAGAIGACLLLLLYPRLSARRLVGTDIAHAVPLSLAAGIGHAALGHVDWRVLAALLMGSLPGIWAGAQASRWLPERLTRALLAAALLAAGARMVA